MKEITKLMLSLCASLLLVACGPGGGSNNADETDSLDTTDTAMEETEENTPQKASATISSASGSTLSGEATFEDEGDGEVSFVLNIEGAAPGTHAVHLHQSGDCSADDATSAGGHWNPTDVEHGHRGADMKFHAGDIDNMEVGSDSTGKLEMTVEGWTIGGPDSTNILNKAVIIHALADDFESQPSGAAGKRVGCGVIQSDN